MTQRRRTGGGSEAAPPPPATTLNKHIRFSDDHHHSSKNKNKRKRKLINNHNKKNPKKNHAATEDFRQWSYSSRDFSKYNDRVVFVSYNILGVENAEKHEDLYKNVQPEYLDWDHRKRLLRKEIKKYNAGVLCLQEVDRFDELERLLRKDGFAGVYMARTGEASDGCAIFWKSELFTLLHEENIQFQRFGLRHNVAQFCVFKMNLNNSSSSSKTQNSKGISSKKIVVGNIHVLFNPNRGDVKLGQMRMFLEKAQTLSSEWGNIPVVLGGDLNSSPESAIYQFIASSELDVRLHDRRKVSGQDSAVGNPASRSRYYAFSRPFFNQWSEEELHLATGERRISLLKHNLELSSAYAGIPGRAITRDRMGEPRATSFHSMFMGTVDYIWHTTDLVPVRVLETLPIHILRRTRGLPSQRWGSDHLALVCELAFIDEDMES
ncbi:mRNA polyadenylation factor [Lithospermum erythrorhizon]|uniref:mRNA polyadenylation factor n=1 Tax=Lithospermum erythrorhizon TaxID=34254 RepID=A0AAV3PP60_LITER